MVYLLLIRSTCFGRCLRPSSGAYHYNYSFWYCIFCGKDIVLCYIVSGYALYCIVSGDVYAHHHSHITITTTFGIVFFVVKILYCVILFRAMHCIVFYCIVSGDVYVHHQAHINITTTSSIVFFCGKDIVLCYIVSGDALYFIVLYCIVLFRAMFSPIIRSISL